MLILTRKIGEALVIGDNGEIAVTILDINRKQIKIGINAPREVAVHREEVYQRIQQKNQEDK